MWTENSVPSLAITAPGGFPRGAADASASSPRTEHSAKGQAAGRPPWPPKSPYQSQRIPFFRTVLSKDSSNSSESPFLKAARRNDGRTLFSGLLPAPYRAEYTESDRQNRRRAARQNRACGPSGVNGMRVSDTIPASVRSVTGAEAWLWRNGSRGVRIMWITRVWLHMDSTNQPAWNMPMYLACIKAS